MKNEKYSFEIGENFALDLDKKDPIASFRKRFYIPPNTIYVDGNSLGLMSKESKKSLNRVVEEWKTLGIGGWLDAKNPWFYFSEKLGELASNLVGAEPNEVIATGTTTVNIHSLVSTFYKPRGKRTKILADKLNFPTDIYALYGQIKLKNLSIKDNLILVPGKNDLVHEEDRIVEMMDEQVALILLPSVLYKSGQLLDMEYLTKKAHEKDIIIGFDCSHSAGNIPHKFDKWGVDFAMWCSYKYLNAGPGSTAFLYVNKKHFSEEPFLPGWFGYKKEKQFDLNLKFESSNSAGGWQISSPAIISSAPIEGSLKLINEAGIDNIWSKSKKITSYLIFLVDKLLSSSPYNFKIGTPRNPNKRSGHIALIHEKEALRINKALKSKGVIPDFRPPNIIRIAPVPLYNSYYEVWKIVQYLKQIIDEKEYLKYSNKKDLIG